MKTYNKPETTEVLLLTTNMLAASDPTKINDSYSDSDEATRQQHGVGGGLWEDMK